MMEGVKIPHKMLSLDPFSQWMGIEIIDCEVGRCLVGMTVRDEMMNSMGKAHGGVSYTLADTAFGFAANSHGKLAVSIETSINHVAEIEVGDYLEAEAIIDITKTKVGFNVIEVRRGEETVALFKGMVYRSSLDWK